MPGDGSSVASSGGNQSAENADPTAANPGLTLDAVTAAIAAAIAPLRDEVRSVRNSEAARMRIAAKGGNVVAPATVDGAAAASGTPDPDSITDPATRAWAKQMQRENEARQQREAEAAEQARKDKASNALKALIDRDKPARAQKLFAMLNPYLKVGTDGKVYHDDGDELRPVEDVFREHIADEIFKPVSVASGTGASSGSHPRIGSGNSGAAKYAAIADPEDRLGAIYADGADL
jgi:hypothetical protein